MPTEPEQLLSWRQLRPLTGNLGRVTVWRMIKTGAFPEPLRVGKSRIAWRASEIRRWQDGMGRVTPA